MYIGITGSRGFIGSTVAEFLVSKGHNIISLDPWVRNTVQKDYSENFKLDWILHFGAKTSILQSFKEPIDTYENNIISTFKALRIAEKNKTNFLYLSSYVYGTPQYIPIDEKHRVNATNPYMGSKLISEQICKQICQNCSIPLLIFRAFNIYGIGYKKGRLISDILIALRDKKLLKLNDPTPRRDYLYIKDFIILLEKVLKLKKIPEGIYNLGSGKSYSNKEVVNLFNKLTENRIGIKPVLNSRPNDIQECVADISKLKKTFSWTPSYSLESGILEIINKIEKLK